MRFHAPASVAALLLALAACARPVARSTVAGDLGPCVRGDSVPLAGRVVGPDGQPAEWALVAIGDTVETHTDGYGCFETDARPPGAGVRVRVHARHLLPADTTVTARPGAPLRIRLSMRAGPPPHFRLEGAWRLRLTLTKPADGTPAPAVRVTEGMVVFSRAIPDHLAEEHPAVAAHEEVGRFDVDLSPFFGGPYARDVSTTVFGGANRDFLREARGEVYARDSVDVIMIPGMSHGGLSLRGGAEGDVVRGRWVQNAYCCGATGTFEMRRVPASPASDTLVAQAIRYDAEARAEIARAEAARAARIGHLRLRVIDTGTGRPAEVRFTAVHVGTDDLSMSYRSGADGWGEWREIEPGTYDLHPDVFPCRGRERWSADTALTQASAVARVTVRSGARTEQEMRLDLCALPAYVL
jgi:hypothetical protein